MEVKAQKEINDELYACVLRVFLSFCFKIAEKVRAGQEEG
jgi:hypothetical protein